MNDIGDSLTRANRRSKLYQDRDRFPSKPLPPMFTAWIEALDPAVQACVILAPGPNGNEYHELVQEFKDAGGIVIAVAQAIEIMPIPSVWMCYDRPSCKLPWFIEHHARAQCTRIFGVNLYQDGWDGEYAFRYSPGFTHLSSRFIPGILQGGATVSGCALQLAIHAKIPNVVLCGIDMTGKQYWNGEQVRGAHGTSGRWPHLSRIDQMIKTARLSTGSEIYTLSEAAHKAKRITPEDFRLLFP